MKTTIILSFTSILGLVPLALYIHLFFKYKRLYERHQSLKKAYLKNKYSNGDFMPFALAGFAGIVAAAFNSNKSKETKK